MAPKKTEGTRKPRALPKTLRAYMALQEAGYSVADAKKIIELLNAAKLI